MRTTYALLADGKKVRAVCIHSSPGDQGTVTLHFISGQFPGDEVAVCVRKFGLAETARLAFTATERARELWEEDLPPDTAYQRLDAWKKKHEGGGMVFLGKVRTS